MAFRAGRKMRASMVDPLRAFLKAKLVGAAGFEPTTPCSQSRCSTRLSYAPTRRSGPMLQLHVPPRGHQARGRERRGLPSEWAPAGLSLRSPPGARRPESIAGRGAAAILPAARGTPRSPLSYVKRLRGLGRRPDRHSCWRRTRDARVRIAGRSRCEGRIPLQRHRALPPGRRLSGADIRGAAAQLHRIRRQSQRRTRVAGLLHPGDDRRASPMRPTSTTP